MSQTDGLGVTPSEHKPTEIGVSNIRSRFTLKRVLYKTALLLPGKR